MPGNFERDFHRDKRQRIDDIRDHQPSTVVEAPIATGEPALASNPADEGLSMIPTGAAEAVAWSSRARGLRKLEHLPQNMNTDGECGAEGGVTLSNRRCSAPCGDSGG
ncbi:unnamed protein product [Phytophthora fragariaefolia]|uniref:Unnamed protein product n=1 Tax=Phytophthora fragariaefolia TaxID=1490495 RepID=A0A9W6YM72_9STRA|nr:unnamed protein product [Phytophthora fragariaefolia]